MDKVNTAPAVCASLVPVGCQVSDGPRCQVAVHKVLRRQVHHARCDLLGDVQHLGLGQLHRPGVLALGHQHGVGTVSPAREQAEGRERKRKVSVGYFLIGCAKHCGFFFARL